MRSLAREIHRSLCRRTVAGKPQPSQHLSKTGLWLIEGDVECAREAAVSARLRVLIGPEWMRESPIVQADAPFMRTEPAWHANPNGICYVHPGVWYDEHLARVDHFRVREPEDAVRWTARWLCDSVDNLVHKHFLGWQAGLKDWPGSWPAYLHAEEGILQYEEEKKAAAH
jgi:hypothetical protein